MFRSGSPSTAMTSARFPAATVPTSPSTPMARAASDVMLRSTTIGSIPSTRTQMSASIHVACRAGSPALPSSLPKRIRTPSSCICAIFRRTMASEAGQLQLNAFEPIIAHSLFKSISHLAAACRTLSERCVRGITANRERARRLLEDSTAPVTALNPYLGYARSSEIAREALATGKRVYDLVLEKKLMTREDLDAILRPEVLTRPHFSTVHRPKGDA